MPLTFEHVNKKEFDAAVADTHGGGRPFINVFAMQEIILQFLLPDQIWCLVKKIGKHPDGSGVVRLRRIGCARSSRQVAGLSLTFDSSLSS